MSRDRLIELIKSHEGKPLEIDVERKDGSRHTLTVVPRKIDGGILIGAQISPLELKTVNPGPLEALKMSVEQNWEWSSMIFQTLGGLFTRETSVKQLMGPVAIAGLSGDAAQERSWIPLFTLMAMISLNLGLLNLMPIPVLDGGHIAILALEGISRRDFSMKVKEKMLLAGFVAPADADGHGHLQRPDAHPVDRASDAVALTQRRKQQQWAGAARVVGCGPRPDERRGDADGVAGGTAGRCPIRSPRSRFSATTPTPARSAARCSRACSRSATACCGPRRKSASSRRRRSSTSATGRRRSRSSRKGMSPAAHHQDDLDSDPDPGFAVSRGRRTGRQFAVMNAKGEYAAFTGPKATSWAGHKGGKFCTAQGNILAGEAVVGGMVDAFEKTTGHLSLRLMAALDAGQAAGGDKRGMQSAAMLIVKKDGGVWLNNDVVLRLQVDDSEQPLKELRRLVEYNHERRYRNR